MKNLFNLGLSSKKIWKEKNLVIKEVGSNNELMVFVLNNIEKFVPKIIYYDNNINKYEYIKGKSFTKVKELSFRNIKKLALIMKSIHNSMNKILSSEEIEKRIVYLHNDLNPVNFIFRFKTIKSIIDWDQISKGDIKNDIYYLLWTSINLGEKNPKNPKIKIKKIKLFIDYYGYDDYIFSNLIVNFKNIMINYLIKAKSENHINLLQIKNWFYDSIKFINENEIFINNIELNIKKVKNET